MVDLKAQEYVDPDGLIVKSGELLARQAIESLRQSDVVRIQLRGLTGISSSYFNIFLRLIREQLGAEALGRIEMLFVSPLQKQVYDRSLRAVVEESSQPRPPKP
jgi:hypothetical protein